MSDWQTLLQSIFIGLIFSYLVAKLISIVLSFKEENLTIIRGNEPKRTKNDVVTQNPRGLVAESGRAHDTESMIAEQGSVRNESLPCSDIDSDDDDWEGVESTELDEMFSAATAFVAATAATSSHKVSNDVQLQLYGLYKIATEGPCSTPQPSALKMTARAKWQAWQKLGAMPPEEAMQKYIDIVTELYPTWAAGSSLKNKRGHDDVASNESKGPMGPVFSSFAYEEESGNDLKMDAIHAFAREGEMDNLLKCIENGVSVNLRDSEGRTPLHWAVDRGHLNISELLVSKNADINAKIVPNHWIGRFHSVTLCCQAFTLSSARIFNSQNCGLGFLDNDGQTPLHYAVVCDREALAEFLVKQNADIGMKDNDGNSPCRLCESDWPWMLLAAEKTD